MNKRKLMLSFLVIGIILYILICNIYVNALNKPTYDPNNASIVNITNKIKNTWASIATVVQIVCVGCVVFAGVRYMYASSDAKANIKKGLIYLTVGAVIVFGATYIMRLIYFTAENTLNTL